MITNKQMFNYITWVSLLTLYLKNNSREALPRNISQNREPKIKRSGFYKKKIAEHSQEMKMAKIANELYIMNKTSIQWAPGSQVNLNKNKKFFVKNDF